MAPTQQAITKALLDQAGTTFAQEAGITLRDKPQPLFRLLVLTFLLSARINASIAVSSAQALSKVGWRSAQQLRDASWDDRVAVLTDGGYTRYREQAATQLGDLCDEVLDRWKGDLRTLREDAGRDPDAIRERLRDFKGVGPAGVEILCREAQAVWPELSPLFDGPALSGAAKVGLPKDPAKLAKLVSGEADTARLAAALVRVDRDDALGDAVRAAAD